MGLQTITKAELAKANTEKQAWIQINDSVYDVTKFINFHPGGSQLLLSFCGTDATEEFYGQHRQEVLQKYDRFRIGTIEGGYEEEKMDTSYWGQISDVPYAEEFAWRGWNSPYHKESHMRLKEYTRAFIDKEIREIAMQSEKTNKFVTDEVMQKISKAGLLHTRLGPGKHLELLPMPAGISVEEFDYFHERIIAGEFARLGVRAPGFLDSIFAGFMISAPCFANYGTPEMKKNILPKILAGEKRSCLAITEAFAGSDVAGLRTTATKTPDGRHYIVNGTKKWITGSAFADYFVAAVRTGGPGAGGISMLMIEKGEGVNVDIIKTNYSSSAGTGYVTFENVKVPVENLMGKENKGFAQVMHNFNHERLAIAWSVTTMSREVTKEMFQWARQRKSMGKPLIQQPVVQDKIGRCIAAVECVEAYSDVMTHQMCTLSYMEQNMMLGGPISFFKYQATRTAALVADCAVQTFGGRGVSQGGMGGAVANFSKAYYMPAVYGGSEDIMIKLGISLAQKAFPDGPESKL